MWPCSSLMRHICCPLRHGQARVCSHADGMLTHHPHTEACTKACCSAGLPLCCSAQQFCCTASNDPRKDLRPHVAVPAGSLC